MALLQATFADAYRLITANRLREFGANKRNGKSGYERIHATSFPNIHHKPKFRLSPTDRFFTIGSCFARNIEKALVSAGGNVLTSDIVVDGDYYELVKTETRAGFLNAFTPHSMRQLLKLADDPRRDSFGLIAVNEDGTEFSDLMTAGLRFLNHNEVSFIRGKLLDAYSRLPDADAVIITLGYTESWRDKQDQIFVNRSPAAARQLARNVALNSNRFEFVNVDASEVREAIADIVSIIGEKTGGRAKIILTVSPIPIGSTYTPMDVISANLYSKSTLVSEAYHAASKFENVDYFPSYEFVTFSNREDTWKDDGVHVQDAIIARVVRKFWNSYLE